MTSNRRREGFALLTVLWVLAGAGAIAFALLLTARGAVVGSQNRLDWDRAAWKAEGCAAVLLSHIDASLRAASADGRSVWRDLDRTAAAAQLPFECTATLRPVGARLNVNGASAAELRALLIGIGASPPAADSMAAAALDWRDPDEIPSPGGAEAAWYAAAGRQLPRNGDLVDIQELRLVRGFETVEGVEAVLGTGGARIPISHAPLAVLAVLPGLGTGALDVVRRGREVQGGGPTSLAAIATQLDEAGRSTLMKALPELASRITDIPEAWDGVIRASSGAPPLVVEMRVRFRHAGSRAAVVSQRLGP